MHVDIARKVSAIVHAVPKPRGPFPRLLGQILSLAGPDAELVRHAERPWSSMTFSGVRYRVMLRFAGDEAVAQGETFIAALPDHEFAIPGRLVADATIAAVDHELVPLPCLVVEAELLLLEDC